MAHGCHAVERARACNDAREFQGAGNVVVECYIGVRSCERCGPGYAQTIAAATGHRQRVFRHGQVVDLEAVPGIDGKLVHVDGDGAADVHIDAVGGGVT